MSRLLVALVLAGLTACAAPSPGPQPAGPQPSGGSAAPSTAPPSSIGAVTFAAVGDSITLGNSADFSAGDVGDTSWVNHARSAGLVHVGGWAANGATTADMRAAVKPVDADVLVLMAGTNDVLYGVPFEETAANIEAIVKAVGARRVVVSAIGPIDFAPSGAVELNRILRELARRHGWQWADPMGPVRDGDRFVQGYASDGLHPSAEAARLIGEELAKTVPAEKTETSRFG